MKEKIHFIHAFLKDESGVTAIEYALLGSLIAVAIVTGVAAVGGKMQTMYDFVSGKVQESVNGS